MSAKHPPWPIAIVTGFLGSGKTTLIRRMLSHPDMRDTMVIVNEFGEIGLDHHLFQAVTDDVILLSNGCMCCRVRQDVVQTLRELYHSWLSGSVAGFGRVLVETTGLAEPSPLVASISGHPLLADSFTLRKIITLVDAEYGLDHLKRGTTSRNQICVADHVFLSKCELVPRARVRALRRRLMSLNPIAAIQETQDLGESLGPDLLFQALATQPIRSSFYCEVAADHLSDVTTLLLMPRGPLSWLAFARWLNELLSKHGPRLLRVKGQLLFDAATQSVIVQAVHHSFYPLEPAPLTGEDFLILIFVGRVPADVASSFDRLS